MLGFTDFINLKIYSQKLIQTDYIFDIIFYSSETAARI
jgi:hypothetical protein